MMRQFENHNWRRPAQQAQVRECLFGACASAPVRQSPLGDGAQLAQQLALSEDNYWRAKAATLNRRTTGARLLIERLEAWGLLCHGVSVDKLDSR